MIHTKINGATDIRDHTMFKMMEVTNPKDQESKANGDNQGIYRARARQPHKTNLP